jgi:hypothetical protein
MARYVVTNTRHDDKQTFICEGDSTLDSIFEQAAEQEGSRSPGYAPTQASALRKVFKLVISRSELG